MVNQTGKFAGKRGCGELALYGAPAQSGIWLAPDFKIQKIGI